MQPATFDIRPGDFKVHVVNGRTKNPVEWAQEITDFILAISDRAPHDLRAQAYAYQSDIRAKIADVMFTAICEQKFANAMMAAKHGAQQVAHAIWHGPTLVWHSSECWAEAVADGVISIADTADDLIRDQANAFRDKLMGVAIGNIDAARQSERVWDSSVARRMGAEEAADAILAA